MPNCLLFTYHSVLRFPERVDVAEEMRERAEIPWPGVEEYAEQRGEENPHV